MGVIRAMRGAWRYSGDVVGLKVVTVIWALVVSGVMEVAWG